MWKELDWTGGSAVCREWSAAIPWIPAEAGRCVGWRCVGWRCSFCVWCVSLCQTSCGMPGSLAAVNLVCIKYCWLLSLDVSSSH